MLRKSILMLSVLALSPYAQASSIRTSKEAIAEALYISALRIGTTSWAVETDLEPTDRETGYIVDLMQKRMPAVPGKICFRDGTCSGVSPTKVSRRIELPEIITVTADRPEAGGGSIGGGGGMGDGEAGAPTGGEDFSGGPTGGGDDRKPEPKEPEPQPQPVSSANATAQLATEVFSGLRKMTSVEFEVSAEFKETYDKDSGRLTSRDIKVKVMGGVGKGSK